MNDYNSSIARGRTMDASTDAGLRTFMLGVYGKLALGLLVSAALAWIAGTVPPVTDFVFNTPFRYVVQFGPLALIVISSFTMRNPSPIGSAVLYWAIVALIGTSLGIWVYAAETGAVLSSAAGRTMSPDTLIIVKAFLITSSAFGALSLYGYTTKRNLGPLGSFMIMALWGVILVGLIGLFFRSELMEYIIMGAVLLLSAGLIAWQTQELKEGYLVYGGDARSKAVMTNWGALNFYILFMNMFQIILSLMSDD